MGLLDLVMPAPLMELTSGRPEIVIGLVNGPVVRDHPDLSAEHIREVPGKHGSTCTRIGSTAYLVPLSPASSSPSEAHPRPPFALMHPLLN